MWVFGYPVNRAFTAVEGVSERAAENPLENGVRSDRRHARRDA